MISAYYRPQTLSEERYLQYRNLCAVLRFRPMSSFDSDREETVALKTLSVQEMSSLNLSIPAIHLETEAGNQVVLAFRRSYTLRYDAEEGLLSKRLEVLDLETYQNEGESEIAPGLYLSPTAEQFKGAQISTITFQGKPTPLELTLQDLTLTFASGEVLVFNGDEQLDLCLRYN